MLFQQYKPYFRIPGFRGGIFRVIALNAVVWLWRQYSYVMRLWTIEVRTCLRGQTSLPTSTESLKLNRIFESIASCCIVQRHSGPYYADLSESPKLYTLNPKPCLAGAAERFSGVPPRRQTYAGFQRLGLRGCWGLPSKFILELQVYKQYLHEL